MDANIVRNSVFPVVVVGKNRTRMTCEVVRNIQNHIVSQKPYFIIVSDRSRDGHGEAIKDFCQKEVTCGWEYLETSKDRYGWGAAINMGLEEAWKISDVAMVVDNDWILQKDIDADRTRDCLMDSGIGCISYKHINAGTNIDTEEYKYFDDYYLVRGEKNDIERPSYVVEIGCMTISKRFHERVGKFLENVNHTDEVEHDFMRRYKNIPSESREEDRILFATPKQYLHACLNGEGHVFTHVGVESQSGRKQTWGCPEKYLDLSDEEKDVEHCKKHLHRIGKVALIAIAKDEDRYIDEWIAYHLKLGFDDIFVYQNDWRYTGTRFANVNNVHWIEFDGKYLLEKAYNNFIDTYYDEFSFGAFLDIDEFLFIRNGNNLKDFLIGFKDEPSIAINWRIFGDSHVEFDKNDKECSVLKRFTRCDNRMFPLCKQIVNFKKISNSVRFQHHPHSIFRKDGSPIFNKDANNKYICHYGYVNEPTQDGFKSEAEIFHFKNKSYGEWMERKNGDDCCRPYDTTLNSLKRWFTEYNHNNIEEYGAVKFMYEDFDVENKFSDKILYSTNGDFHSESPLNKTLDVLNSISGNDTYVVPSNKFGKEAFYEIFRKAILEHYDYIIYSDADNLIVSKENLFSLFGDFKKHSDCIFGGCPDGGVFCHRNHNPMSINPFLLFVRVPLLAKYYDASKDCFTFNRHRTDLTEEVKNVIDDYAEWRKATGYRNKFAEKISGFIENPQERQYFGGGQKPWTYSIEHALAEPYYDIFLGLHPEDKIFSFYGGDLPDDTSGISAAIHWFGDKRHAYDGYDSLVSIHTWFARFGMEKPTFELAQRQYDRIKSMMNFCNEIDWKEYVDRIYCIHYEGFKEREENLNYQFDKVGISGSGNLEYVITKQDNEVKEFFDKNKSKELQFIGYASEVYGWKKALKDALDNKYERILIVEDDICFLKSRSEIKNILDNIPRSDYDIIQLSHIPGQYVDVQKISKASINNLFYKAEGLPETDSSCVILKESGIKKLYDFLNKRPCGLDMAIESCGGTVCRSKNPLVIQKIYSSSLNLSWSSDAQSYIDKMYRKIGLDYGDYETEENPIHWKSYVDGIYCLHFSEQDNKLPRLVDEFRRVGIYESGIFEFMLNYSSPYDKVIFDKYRNARFCPAVSYVNVCLGVRRIIQDALHKGLHRVLFFEDDVAFLKSKKEIKKIMDTIPNDADLVQFDNFVCQDNADYYRQLCTETDGNFIKMPKDRYFTSAACLYMNDKGMREMLRIMDEMICATDQIYGMMDCNVYVSKKHLAAQAVYSGSVSTKEHEVKIMHDVYALQGLDYKDYNFPEGYGYLSSINEKGEVMDKVCEEKNDKVATHLIGDKCKGRKKVSVYAITKNESHLVDKWMSSMSEADEVVVLDTGSTDDTVEHLRRLGARVEVEKFDPWKSVEEYDAIVAKGGNPWRFDKARNDSMALVSEDADILITTDIDEFIQPGWRKKLEDQWIAAEERGEHPTCAAYKYVWCFNPDGTEARTFFIHKIHKRNVCKWTHMIHEVLSYDKGHRPVQLNDFTVEHHQDFSKSRTSYLPMLEVSARDNPENDRDAHYYGRELMYVGRWDEAIAELKRHLSLRSASWPAERAASMRYIANCYKQKGNEDLWELWMMKAMEEDLNHREASFNLGLVYMDKKDYRTAERVLGRCLDIPTNTQEYICDGRCWTAKPWILMSQAKWWNGDWAGAEHTVRKAVELYPNDGEAKAQLEGMSSTRKKYNR